MSMKLTFLVGGETEPIRMASFLTISHDCIFMLPWRSFMAFKQKSGILLMHQSIYNLERGIRLNYHVRNLANDYATNIYNFNSQIAGESLIYLLDSS